MFRGAPLWVKQYFPHVGFSANSLLGNESTQGEQHNVEAEAATTDEAARPRGTDTALSTAWQAKVVKRPLEMAAKATAMGMDERTLERMKETVSYHEFRFGCRRTVMSILLVRLFDFY